MKTLLGCLMMRSVMDSETISAFVMENDCVNKLPKDSFHSMEESSANKEVKVIRSCTMLKTVAAVAFVSLFSASIWAQGQTTTSYPTNYNNTFKPIAGSTGAVGEWSVVTNWQTGALTSSSSSHVPLTGGVPGIQGGNLAPLVVDGFIIGDSIATTGGYKTVHAPQLEGWIPTYGAFNSVHLKIDSLRKIQGGSPRWDVDETSKITLMKAIPYQEAILTLHVKSKEGVVFSLAPTATNIRNFDLNLYQQGSIQYDEALNVARGHVIKSLILNCTDQGDYKTITSRQLIGFASANGNPTFSVDTAGVENNLSSVSLTRKAEGTMMITDAVGSYSFRRAGDGYYVDYVTMRNKEANCLGVIKVASANWGQIDWGVGNNGPTLATDTVFLSWDDSLTSETLALHFDQVVTSGQIIFNVMKPLTLTKNDVALSIAEYAIHTPVTFGAGYPTLPNCTATSITLASAQTASVQSVAGKTITYTGGAGVKILPEGVVNPSFNPSNGGVINLTGGTYHFSGMIDSAMSTSLTIGNTEGTPVVVDIPNFYLGTVDATINEGANITVANSFLLSQGGAGRATVLTQTGGTVTVNGRSSIISNAASVMLGHYNGPSTYSLMGGSFSVPNTIITMGCTLNTHLFDIAGNNAIATAQGFALQNNATGSNTLKIRNGGIFNVGAQGINVNSKVLNFTIDGGSLAASASFSSNAPLTVGVGGATVNTATHTVTFNGAVSGAGKLTQAGTGTLAWGNASLPQSIEVGDGSTLSIATTTLSMTQEGQKITAIGTGKVQLPATLNIDLGGRNIQAEGAVTLIANVEAFDGKTITLSNAPLGVRFEYPKTGPGSITATYSANQVATWGSASGDWMNGSTSPSPWLNEVAFANGKTVLFGDVLDVTTATVYVSGDVAPQGIAFANTTTAYTFEDKVEGSKVIGTFNTVDAMQPITFNNTVQGKIVVNSDGVTIKKLPSDGVVTTLEVAANRAVTFDGIVWDSAKMTKQNTSEFIFANTVSADPLTALPLSTLSNVKATIRRPISISGDFSLGKNGESLQDYTLGNDAIITTSRFIISHQDGVNSTLSIENGAHSPSKTVMRMVRYYLGTLRMVQLS